MKMSEHLHIRIGETERKMLAQLYERFMVNSMSQLVRLLIRFAYNHNDLIEPFIENEVKEERKTISRDFLSDS